MKSATGFELVVLAAEVGAQARRGCDGRGVLEADHHVADGPVADVQHRSGDGDDGLAGGRHHLGRHAVDAHLQERHRTRLARGRVRGAPRARR